MQIQESVSVLVIKLILNIAVVGAAPGYQGVNVPQLLRDELRSMDYILKEDPRFREVDDFSLTGLTWEKCEKAFECRAVAEMETEGFDLWELLETHIKWHKLTVMYGHFGDNKLLGFVRIYLYMVDPDVIHHSVRCMKNHKEIYEEGVRVVEDLYKARRERLHLANPTPQMENKGEESIEVEGVTTHVKWCTIEGYPLTEYVDAGLEEQYRKLLHFISKGEKGKKLERP